MKKYQLIIPSMHGPWYKATVYQIEEEYKNGKLVYRKVSLDGKNIEVRDNRERISKRTNRSFS